MNKKESWKVRV